MPEHAALIGRDREVARIRQLLDDAIDGHGAAVLVTGVAGIGKSRLASAAAAIAGDAGMRVHIGRAQPRRVTRPLAPLLDALDLRGDELLGGGATATRTVLEAGALAAVGFLLAERVLEAIEARCSSAPILLVLEDIQWAEPATLDALELLLERASGLTLAVILTSRSVPAAGATSHLARVPRLALGPLGPAEIAALAATVIDAPSEDVLSLLESSDGNPLLVLAVINELRTTGQSTGGAAALSSRITELDAEVIRTLQAAAVLGPAVHGSDLAALLRVRTVDLLAPLSVACDAGVLDGDGGSYHFRHELYRDAVLATLPVAARSALHVDAARALAEAGAQPLDVAEHYAQGARPGDTDAIAWLHRAAAEMVATAPGEALRVLDVVASLLTGPAPGDLLLSRVQALAGAGHMAEAESLGRTLLRPGMSPTAEAAVQRELALAMLVQGRAKESVAAMGRVAELTRDSTERGRVLAEVGIARILDLDEPGARAAANEALAEGRRVGDVAAQVGGSVVLCWLDNLACRFGASLAHAGDAMQLARQPNAAGGHLYQPWFFGALARFEADDFDGARQAADEGRRVSQRTGTAWAIPGYDAVTAFVALRAGELDDAAASAEAALSYLEGVDGFGVAVWCQAFLAQIALHRGAEEEAERRLATAEQWLVQGRGQLGVEQVLLVRARLAERKGDVATATGVIALAWDLLTDIGALCPRQQLGPVHVRLARSTGDIGRAEQVVSEMALAADRAGTPMFLAEAERAAALLHDDADAARLAVEHARLGPRRLELADTILDLSRVLAAGGDTRGAAGAAEEAAALYAASGADADAAAVAPRPRRSKPRASTGLDALTSTERQVLELIAEGLSNAEIADRLFVSRRTIESHVSAAYRKLGVRSRVDLARAVLAQPKR